MKSKHAISFKKSRKIVKPSFKEDADVNNIMRRYTKTGQLPALMKQNPHYGDFSNVKDYQESMDIVIHAQQQFAALPAETRSFFNHDPSRMLSFVSDPKNKTKMIEMGLAIEKASVTEEKTKTLNNVKPAEKTEVTPSEKKS